MASTALAPDRGSVHELAARFEVVSSPEAFEREWREFARTALGHVFAEYDFVALWLRWIAPRRGVEPRIVAVRDGAGRLTAIAPLGLRQSLGVRNLEWLGGEQADYQGGLYDRGLLAALAPGDLGSRFVAAIIDLAGGDLVRLERQPADFEGLPNPFATLAPQRHPDDAYHTLIGTDWKSYYDSKRQASSRRVDKRKLKKLESAGPLEFLVAENSAAVDRILEVLFVQKARSLGEMGVSDLFATDDVRGFYRALGHLTHPMGPSHIAALVSNGEIVATNWGLVRGTRYYYVMHAFCGGEIARQSPGRHLMYRLMQWAMDHGVAIFDFTIGSESYKEKWCEGTTRLFTSTYPRSARGAGAAAALRGTTALKRLIKTTPALWRAAEFARRRLGRGAGDNAAPSAE